MLIHSKKIAFKNAARALTGIRSKTIAVALGLSMAMTVSAQQMRATGLTGPGGNSAAPNQIDFRSTPATAVSPERALTLFDEVADNRRIPFQSPFWCFARAEEMRRIFEDKGIKVLKVWAFREPDRPLEFQGPSAKDMMLPWDYHVAVALPVITRTGEKKIYVIDPTVFDAPAEIAEWAQKLGANPQHIRLTAPDDVPSQYFDVTHKPNVPFTKDSFTAEIAHHIGHYYNAGSVRHVYPAKLREELCSKEDDGAACKKRGRTWVAETRSFDFDFFKNLTQSQPFKMQL